MKTIFRLAALMLLLVGVCLSQGTPATLGNVGVLLDQNFFAGSVATAGIPVTSGEFNGYNYYKVEFTPLSGSNITTCQVYVDSTLNNQTWSQGGAISGQTCTSEGSATNGPVAANSVRINIVVAGQGQVRVRLLGAMSSLAGGGGGGTVSSVALALPSGLFSISGSPVTGSGTLTATFQTIAAHLVLGNNTSSPAVAGLVQLGFGDLTGTATVGQLPFTYTTLNSITKLVTAGTFSGSVGAGVCLDSNQNLTTSGCPSPSQTWPLAAGIMVYAGGNVFGTSLTAPTGAIVGTTDAQALTNKSIVGSEINSGTVGASFLPAALSSSTSINGLNITATTGTFTLAAGKLFVVNNGLTLAGTDSTTQTFPSTSGTVVTSVTTAGGDLSGSYPSPTVAKVNGLAVPTSAALVGTNSSGQLVANTSTIANNTSGTAAGLAASATTTALADGCLSVTSNVIGSVGCGGGIGFPTGSGIPIVVTGTSWGTTVTAPTGLIVGAGQANTWTTGLQTFTNATIKLPASAGYAPTTAALFGYDSTNNRAVLGNGTNTSVLPWITAAPTTLHLAEFNGTLGLMDDSAIATANVVTQTSNGAANQIATYSTTNKVLVPATTLPTAAEPAHTGDATNSAGSLAMNVSKINGTTFTGTLNDLVAFGTGGNIPLDTGVLYTNLTTQTSNGAANQVCTYTGANKTCVPGTVPNAALTNSTIGINGTSNQITSSSSTPALGGSTTLAIANPFTFPGKFTAVAGATGAASFNVPSGVAPTSPASGDVWNASGIVKFYDGTNTNSFVTIQSAVTSGHCPQFSGTAGLLVDSGTICPTITGLAASQVVVASSSSAITSYAGFTSDSSGNVTAASFTIGGSNLNAGVTLLSQPTGTGGAAPTGTNAVGLAAPTSVPTSYNVVLPSAGSSGYLKISSTVNQTGCTASATNLCGLWEASIDLTADVGATILPGANGGTGIAFVAFTGPSSSLKTFTLPNASATILTNNAAVTVGQGGTGVNTQTAHAFLLGEGTAAVASVGPCATGLVAVGQGSSADPICTSVPLSSFGAAAGVNTINNGNSPQTWDWALTADAESALTVGETSASTTGTLTSGLANQKILSVLTTPASTATPLNVTQGSVTGTIAFPVAQFQTTWNNAGLTGEGILLNVTNTSSAAGSLLFDLQVGHASQFKVDKAGAVTGTTVTLGTDNSVAGTLTLANSAAAAHTIFSSGATTTNTIQGFAAVPTTGHVLDCTVTSTTCLLHDSGVVTANVVNASSPGVGIAHFAGSTQTVTSSLIVAADITSATITGTQLASSLALTTPNVGAATGTSLLVTGIVDGTVPVTVTTGTSATLGAATYKSGYTFNQEATAGTGVTYTLPATAVGLQYCVRNSIVSGTGAADTGVLTVYPAASSYVILNGVRNTIGGGGTHGVASGGAAGDSACFIAVDATDWEVLAIKGTWTAN